ncbi:MAG: BREX-1 system adenine-specific DNA-methyltransferase PglX [Candidatus Azobacteroides sp.]|nr:BREX-1 system adenine-specific DNA-methyltransferase PglX [Candidatus Azobacteroides sp.]
MDKQQLQNIFKNPYSTTNWQQVLQDLFKATELRREPKSLENEGNENVEGFELGRIVTSDGYEIGLYEFEIKSRHNIKMNRVGLRGLVKNFLKFKVEAALVVYYNSNEWRLSFICDLQDEKTAPKRFTYLFGNDTETYRTPIERFLTLAEGKVDFTAIREAFSVEKLSREFFKDYKSQYDKFLKYLGAEQKKNRDYVKKLLGRLVFLQFLQKKGWMGVPATNAVNDWNGGDKNYLLNLFRNTPYQDIFLNKVLEILFFDTLNKERPGDLADPVLGENIRIPYLNGGLFEPDITDKNAVNFPAEYFRGLLEFFGQYNFTIDENDPSDAEVGIDPEMLGHIFENLLEDNKDKGAFYTPKEIVRYMCQQSLIEYLQTKLGKHPQIEEFIKTGYIENRNNKMNFIVANAKTIEQLLDTVKICDPAIGSGAFPMGILSEIFRAKMALNLTLDPAEVKKEIIQNSIYGVDIEQGAVDIARLRFWLSLVVDEKVPQPLPNLDYKIMCGNSLLSRFLLDTPINEVFAQYNKEHKTNFTLDSYKKLVLDYTNTSLPDKKNEFRKTIEEIKGAFKTELADSKIRDRQKLENKIKELESPTLFGGPSKENLKEAKILRAKLDKMLHSEQDIINNKLYEDSFEWRFELPCILDEEGRFMGFDIVIGNPPYLRIQGIREGNPAFADELSDKYDAATGSFDMYALFVERGLQIIKETGLVNYIMPVKWTNAAFGKGLRDIASREKSANRIVNFGAYQVFNASTYTGLQWFKPNSEILSYIELDRNLDTNQDLGVYLDTLEEDSFAKLPANKLTTQPWVLTVGNTTTILNNLDEHPRRMNDIFDKIFQGLATSKDDVYFLHKCSEQNNIVIGYSEYLKREIHIERGLVKPLLKGKDVHRYDTISTNRFVIFPYILAGGNPILYTENEIADKFPLGYAYLKECEPAIRGREKGRLINDKFWYKYIYPKNLVLFDNEKLVAPDISLGGNFAYDLHGKFYQTTTIYGYIKKPHIKESYKLLMALFNSKLCWWFLVNTGTTLANGFFRFKPDYIKPFPVPKEISLEVDKLVSRLVDFQIYLHDSTHPDIFGHTSNERLITHIDDILNMVIYELYFEEHMKEKEINVINYLQSYLSANMDKNDLTKEIEKLYLWYQDSDNMVRQRIMLIETRSKNMLYEINKTTL